MGKKTSVVESESFPITRVVSNDIMKPPQFSGEGDSIEAISAEWQAWKASMNNFIAYLKESGQPLSKTHEVRIRLSGLKGHAIISANDLLEKFETPTWKEVEQHLDTIFLGSINAHTLIASLKGTKQSPGQSVSQYAAEFNAIHRRLVKIGVSNRDVAAQWFVEGLHPKLNKIVQAKLMEGQPLQDYDINDAMGAVARVTNLAISAEMLVARPERENERWYTGSGSQSWRNSSTMQRYSTARPRNSQNVQVNSIAVDFATRLGVSHDLIQKRMKAKECFHCGSNNHQLRGCPKIGQAAVHSLDIDQTKSKNE